MKTVAHGGYMIDWSQCYFPRLLENSSHLRTRVIKAGEQNCQYELKQTNEKIKKLTCTLIHKLIFLMRKNHEL